MFMLWFNASPCGSFYLSFWSYFSILGLFRLNPIDSLVITSLYALMLIVIGRLLNRMIGPRTRHEWLRKESPLNPIAMVSPNNNMLRRVVKISSCPVHTPVNIQPVLPWPKYSCWPSKTAWLKPSYLRR